MSRVVQLRDIAHARAGDKGNRSNVAVFVRDAAHYPAVLEQITPQRVKREFGKLFRGAIVRHDLPNLQAINLVMDEALEGGVNGSLNLDSHGKSFSYLILGLQVTLPD
jgi:hypothetical protein